MERSREYDDVAAALAEMRPAPRPEFAADLDQWAAGGFPRRKRGHTPRAALATRLRGLVPQRPALAGAAAALTAIVVATVVVAGNNSSSTRVALDDAPQRQLDRLQSPARPDGTGQPSSAKALSELEGFSRTAPSASGGVGLQSSGQNLSSADASADLLAAGKGVAGAREVERSARISLLADPADVADDSAKVFAAVHDADGIVLHSTTSSGAGAGARFALLIPSARLGDALAALSSIDEVSSRHEATDDITAPTSSAREELRDSRARIDTLLAQLAAAETETEAEAVETELRGERRHAARLRAQLANLDRRTTYSRVSVRIASDPSADSGGAWGLDDAIGDAGKVLAVAAAVTIVGLAIAAPIALITLLAWLAHRLWLRTRRERALDT
ncbi:MAG TPA: DUF4349 domain-containing protein [Solirubrobacterales bacterium]|nr:DUF4349 domain-containing protein [Solirubrobacterales bacterium]